MTADLEKTEWDTIRGLLQDNVKSLRREKHFCETPFQRASYTRRITKLNNIINKIPNGE